MSVVLTLDPFTIDPDRAGRIGLFFPAKAEALGVLMKHNGQNDPIKVEKLRTAPKGKVAGVKFEWRLIAGLHRLEGALREGLEIKAIEVSGDAATVAHIQASENLDRRDLEPLERAMFVRAVADAARLRVLELRGGEIGANLPQSQSRAAKAQFSEWEKADEAAIEHGSNLSRAYGWRDECAGALGLSLDDLKRSMRIHRLIVEPFPDLLDTLKDHRDARVTDKLLKLCAIADEGARRTVIEMMTGPNDFDLAAAMTAAGITDAKPAPSPFQKSYDQILGAVGRLPAADWRRACSALVADLDVQRRAALRAALIAFDAAEANQEAGQ